MTQTQSNIQNIYVIWSANVYRMSENLEIPQSDQNAETGS
jgi:hypothetical protein